MKPKKLLKETHSFLVTKYTDKGPKTRNIEVVAEKPFQILVNDQNVVTVMLTPSYLEEFLAGFLVGQGIISSIKQIEKTLIEPEKGLLWAQVNEPVEVDLSKSIITSGCSGGIALNNFDKLPKLQKSNLPEIDIISYLMKKMLASGRIYRKSGGVHSACLASAEEGIIFQVEDIGRHNCIDKLIGYLLANNINPEGKIILTTGRISLEAIPKVARAGINILGSRSTPTDLAIDLAKKLNIRLLGYIRAGKITVYS